MAITQMTIPGCKCERCGHEWIARKSRNLPPGEVPRELPKPRMCPKCKSAWWDTPRVEKYRVASSEGC